MRSKLREGIEGGLGGLAAVESRFVEGAVFVSLGGWLFARGGVGVDESCAGAEAAPCCRHCAVQVRFLLCAWSVCRTRWMARGKVSSLEGFERCWRRERRRKETSMAR